MPAPPAFSWRRCLVPAVLATMVGLAFLPVLRADFVNWDDNINFLTNPFYRGLSSSHLSWMFTAFHMGHYQPLAWLTLGADYVLWGMNPAGYHFTNLLIHCVNSALCYFLFLKMLEHLEAEEGRGRTSAAAVGALFWSIHPLRVESVAWVTERRDVLCGLFFLLAILAYVRMVRARIEAMPWKKWLTLSCAAFAASLLSKSLGIMLPFVLLVLDVYPLRRFTPEFRTRVLLEKLPFLALAIADGLIMIAAMRQIGQVRDAGTYAIGDRILQGGYGLWFYVWKTVLPFQLHAFYAMFDSDSLWSAEYVGPLLGSVAITAALITARRRWPGGLAAWVCYAILLVPVLGFFVRGYQRAADRYSYLSCLPLSFLAAAGMAALCSAKESGRMTSSAHRWATGAVVLVLAALGILSFVQAGVWKDSMTLFERVLAYEQRAALPFVNRGAARQDRGDLQGALADYASALRIDPRSVDAYTSRGKLLHEKGDSAGAMSDYNEAIAIDSRDYEAYNNRASLKLDRRDWDGALADVDHALSLRTWEPEPYGIRASVLLAKGKPDAAILDIENALRLAPPGWKFQKAAEGILERARKLKAGR
jgi:hypothetical protein